MDAPNKQRKTASSSKGASLSSAPHPNDHRNTDTTHRVMDKEV